MTEQELRTALQTHLALADLPDRRRQALLAAIREDAAAARAKGDATMFRPSKFRTVLIAALIVTLLSATVALAASFSGYVNFRGESVDHTGRPVPTPMPADEEYQEDIMLTLRMQDLLNASPQDQLVRVTHDRGIGFSGSWRSPSMNVTSLEELTALLPEDVTLPRIPEGYTFRFAQVSFDCAADSAYELVRDETREDGITIKGYRIPEGKQVPSMISYTLTSSGGGRISVSINLEKGAEYLFSVNDAQNVETPDIPGMDEAILITKPTSTKLSMQRVLANPIPVVDPIALHTRPDAPAMTLTHMVVHLSSPTAPADVLLAMYP